MQENFQITIVVVAGSILLISLVFFIILSSIMYQKARNNHEQSIQNLRDTFEKELLQVNIETKQSTLNRISEEIHDNVGQLLSLVKLNLYQINKKEKNEKIADTIALTNRAILGLRNVSHIISSNKLKNNNILGLIQKEVNQLNKTEALSCEFKIPSDFEEKINAEVTLILYRMIQEIINNIIKHANASKVIISVEQKNTTMKISIEDNGQGFDLKNKKETSNGLLNLQRRAKLIKARLTIKTEKEKGTKISITIENIATNEN